MASIQTLSDADRRTVARWAAACAERVVSLFVADDEAVEQVQDALARTNAYARGESTADAEIAKRMIAVKAAGRATTPAGAAAARSVAQASAVAHMGAHALGAAAYAAKAVSIAEPDRVDDEVHWQLDQLTADERVALRRLPLLGDDSAGPLGPGLLSRGVLGTVIEQIQSSVGDPHRI